MAAKQNLDGSPVLKKSEVITVVGTGFGQRNPTDPYWWEVPHSGLPENLKALWPARRGPDRDAIGSTGEGNHLFSGCLRTSVEVLG
jgi:hypothetical protein